VVAMSSTPFPAFPDLPDPQHAFLQCLGSPPLTGNAVDCNALRAKLATCVLELWRDLPPVEDVCGDAVFPTVPLAIVNWSRFDHPTTQILNIDNVSTRPLALGVATLRALVESLAGCSTGGV